MKAAQWRECEGEAHQNEAHADGCGVCAPFWGRVPTCPDCASGLLRPRGKRARSWACRCGKRWDVTGTPGGIVRASWAPACLMDESGRYRATYSDLADRTVHSGVGPTHQAAVRALGLAVATGQVEVVVP